LAFRRNGEPYLNYSRWAHVFRNDVLFKDQKDAVVVLGCDCGNARCLFTLSIAQGTSQPGDVSLSAFTTACDKLGSPCKHTIALSLCTVVSDGASLADIPTVAQLEGAQIRVSVGLPESAFLSRAVCEKTLQGWRCLKQSCSAQSSCEHALFLQEESSLQSDLAGLLGNIDTKLRRERKAWTPEPIGLRKIPIDILAPDWDSSGQVFARAAHGLSSLADTHHATPPLECACGAGEGDRESKAGGSKAERKCLCGTVCPKCGSSWREKSEPDCQVSM
jgi:hypothetical protein